MWPIRLRKAWQLLRFNTNPDNFKVLVLSKRGIWHSGFIMVDTTSIEDYFQVEVNRTIHRRQLQGGRVNRTEFSVHHSGGINAAHLRF